MKPEVGSFLAKARKSLLEARAVIGINLTEAAGRASYFAAYHTAQALIFDRSGKVAKTHSGVRSEFSRLTKDDPAIDREFSVFLGRSYMFKVIADYEIETGGVLPRERIQEAIATAARFIDHITALVQPPTAPTPETTSDPAA